MQDSDGEEAREELREEEGPDPRIGKVGPPVVLGPNISSINLSNSDVTPTGRGFKKRRIHLDDRCCKYYTLIP